MAQEIYLYAPITQYVAEYFNRELNWLEGRDVDIRMTTQGGYTASGKAMITGMKNYKGYKTVYVDGDVASMGSFMLMFADKVIASSMSQIMFHTARFSQRYTPTQSEIDSLAKDNSEWKKAMEARLGEKGKELVEKIFKDGSNEDVYLSAKEALEYGVVDEIVEMDVEQKAAFQMKFHTEIVKSAQLEKEDKTKSRKMADVQMTQAEFDAKIAEARQDGENSGAEKGAKQEADRVAAWNKYSSVDPKAVQEGIESGKEISQAQREDFLIKIATKTAKGELKGENPGNTDTGGSEEETEEQKQAKLEQERKERLERMKKRM